MKCKLLFIAVLSLFANNIFSQEWEVVSFKEDTSYNPKIYDYNQKNESKEEPCYLVLAIIKSDNVKFTNIKEYERGIGNIYYIYIHEDYYQFRVFIDGKPIDINLAKHRQDKSNAYDWPKNKTYVLNFSRSYPNKSKANMKALAMSIVPGIGLMQKGYTAEGVAYLVGDIALIGGGIGLGIYGKNQKKIMNDRNTTLDDYKKAKNNYDTAKTASYICYGAAAGVYIINLIRSYVVRPKPDAPLQWAIVPEMNPSIDGLGKPNMSLNLALTYNF